MLFFILFYLVCAEEAQSVLAVAVELKAMYHIHLLGKKKCVPLKRTAILGLGFHELPYLISWDRTQRFMLSLGHFLEEKFGRRDMIRIITLGVAILR